MDEGLITPADKTPDLKEGRSPDRPGGLETAVPCQGVPPLDINEMHEFSAEQLESLARDFDLRLHPTRSIHQHIVDIIRAALNRGSRVTAEGFLDQVGDAFALLRYPQLNFLPVPEDVCVSRAIIEQFHLRPGQWLAGTLPLPRRRWTSTSCLRNSRKAGSCWRIRRRTRSARGRSIFWRRSGAGSAG